MGTSSAEIAAELRGQILAGKIRPGEFLPSAREITRRWNVAIATASRAHALLRAEGLAASVPGLGTVVSATAVGSGGPGRSDPTPRGPQSPVRRRAGESDDAAAERIVTAAISIADAEGTDSLTMRRISHTVQMSPAVLKRLSPNRDALLAEMMNRALQEWDPGKQDGSWRENLISGHRGLWRVFRRHPWLAPRLSVTRPQLVPAALVFAEWAIRTLTQAGIAPEDSLETHILLFTQARGTAILLEPEAEAESVTGIDADTWIDGHMDRLEELSTTANHALLKSLIGSGYALDLDRAYERGLRLMVDGIASRIAATR